nr:MerR family transcriptional regulator [Conexibacter arvalis]
MTVGQFARMTRLSARQLRSYDALGLLAPARVDPETGYRYYHPRQARTAVTIALLRSLDVPLPAIAELLVADEEGAERILAGERARVAAELAARERTLRALERLTSERELMPYPVETAIEPPRRLLALRGTSDAEHLHADAAALVARLGEALPWAVAPDPPVVGLYPLDLDGELAFHVGVEPPAAAGEAPGAPPAAAVPPQAREPLPPGVEPLDLPGGPVARVLHVGSHDELPLAYFPLLAWLQERGHPAVGPVRERHLDDPATVAPERLRTEVSILLHDTGGTAP